MNMLDVRFREEETKGLTIPAHIAITPDGNRRWVENDIKRYPKAYREACDQAYYICHCCLNLGVRVLTLWGLAMANRKRSEYEQSVVFSVITEFITRYQGELHELGVRVHHFGDPAPLPDSLQTALSQVCKLTKYNHEFYLNLAVNYGGQEEITRAMNLILQEKTQKNNPTPVTQKDIEEKLYTGILPAELRNPDFMIRTGGCARDSGYLLYQGAYTPKYVTPILWPDFDKAALLAAIRHYNSIQQNFGA